MTGLEKLQKSYTVIGVNCTGGGSGLAPELLSRGGSSGLLDFFNVTYSQESLERSIGPVFEFCNMDTANRMAYKALGDIVINRPGHQVGIGITASLTTGPNQREGRINNAFVSIICAEKQETMEIDFNKLDLNYNDRESQEESLVNLAIFQLLSFCNISDFPRDFYKNGAVKRNRYRAPVHFPGSFNPIHKQHIKIANYVSDIINTPLQLSIADTNVDKGPLSQEEFIDRASEIRNVLPNVKVSMDKGLFIDKAKQSPFTTFVVGTDTINRVLDPQYYKNYDTALFSLFIKYKARFLVFQRQGYDMMQIPAEYKHLVDVMDESEYLDDGTSSSKIRASK